VWHKYKYLPFWPCKVTEVEVLEDSGKTEWSLEFFGDGTEVDTKMLKKLFPFKSPRHVQHPPVRSHC
jgi:hypothetical protein